MVTTETPPVTSFPVNGNGTTLAKPMSWAEIVRQMPPQLAEGVLMWQLKELLTELVNVRGDVGRIDIETDDTDYVGYFVPARAEAMEAERVLPKLTPEREAELERRIRAGGAVPIRELIGSPIAQAVPSQQPGS